MFYIHGPESPPGIPVDGMSRIPVVYLTQITEMLVIQPLVIVVIVYAVIISRPQRTPRNPGRPVIEGNEPRRPEVKGEGWSRQPAPTESRAAIPSPVMVRKPAPRLIGNPGPSPYRPIAPAADGIGRPGNTYGKRHPRSAIGFHCHPPPIAVQFGRSNIHITRQIAPAGVHGVTGVAAIVPFIPGVEPGITGNGVHAVLIRRNKNLFSGFDPAYVPVTHHLQLPFSNDCVGIAVVPGIESIQPPAKHYERSSGRIHFESGAARHRQGGKPGQDAYLDEIFTQREKLDIGILGEPVHGSLVELYLGSSLRSRVDPVSGPQRQIDAGRRPFRIRWLLETDGPFHVRNSRNADILSLILLG